MIARVEATQNWLENVTHQMNNMVSQSLSHPYVCVALNMSHSISELQRAVQQSCRVSTMPVCLSLKLDS